MALQSANPPEVFTLEQFKGLNQQSRRASIDDQEEYWNENLFGIGPGNLRSCFGASAPIYTVPTGLQIRRIFLGYYGNNTPLYGVPPPGRKCWVMLSDGTADEVDLDDQSLNTPIGGPSRPVVWNPIAPYWWCSVKVWRPRWVGSQLGEIGGIVIGSPAGLFAWDGYTLYSPGGPAPLWLTNADTTPFPGQTTMPDVQDLPGIYCMEVYENRLWVAGKNVIGYSMPGNGADFLVADGGGFVGYFGDKLVHDYFDMQQSSGYLFLFGDSSVDVINNVQMSGGTGGTAPVTNFNYYNLDPMVGQRFPRPVGRWGRYFVMSNGDGLYEMAGGDAIEIGQKTLNVFNTLDLSSNLYPSFATATMFGSRVMLANGRFTDPFGVNRTLMFMWHGEDKWSVASQWWKYPGNSEWTQIPLIEINHYEDNSVITPYGTDGTYLFKLFDHPDEHLPKRLSTKFYAGQGAAKTKIKSFTRVFLELHDNDGRGAVVTGTATSRGGSLPNGTQPVHFEIPGGPVEQLPAENVQGRYGNVPCAISGQGLQLGIDLQSTSPDFTIERVHFYNEDRTLYGA